MFRRSLANLMGSKPPRRVPNPPFLHASQRPAEKANIDFNSLKLTYPLTRAPEFSISKSGWAPPPENVPPTNLPFLIERTEAGKGLPVYTDFKGGRTKVITILRKIKGDVHALKGDLEKIVGKSVKITPGKVVIEGNYHKRLKLWLIGLGF